MCADKPWRHAAEIIRHVAQGLGVDNHALPPSHVHGLFQGVVTHPAGTVLLHWHFDSLHVDGDFWNFKVMDVLLTVLLHGHFYSYLVDGDFWNFRVMDVMLDMLMTYHQLFIVVKTYNQTESKFGWRALKSAGNKYRDAQLVCPDPSIWKSRGVLYEAVRKLIVHGKCTQHTEKDVKGLVLTYVPMDLTPSWNDSYGSGGRGGAQRGRGGGFRGAGRGGGERGGRNRGGRGK